MKKKNLSDYVVAFAVVLSSAVLLAALYFAIAGGGGGGDRTLFVDMPSVTGLRVHSQVRYAGTPVGRVMAIRVLDWPERVHPELAIRVQVRLDKEIPQLKVDSYASISADTVLAEKFLDLSPGTQGAPPLPEGAPLAAAPGAQSGDLLAAGARLVADLSALVTQLRADYPGMRDSFAGVLGAARELSAEAGAVVAKADALLADAAGLLHTGNATAGELRAFVATADAVAQEAGVLVKKTGTVVQHADGLIARLDALAAGGAQGSWERPLTDLRATLQNLRVTSAYLQIFSDRVSREPWRLVWGTRQELRVPSREAILQGADGAPVGPVER